MISVIQSAFAIGGEILVWAVITDPKRDSEGQRGRFARYSAEDRSDTLPMGWMESLRLKKKCFTSKLDKQMGNEEILKELISP